MPIFRAKQTEVTAVQHPGPSKLVVVGRKGEQTASVGDFIVFYGERPEDREVISNKDFFDKYEAVDGTTENGITTDTYVDQSQPVAGVDKNTQEAYDSAVASAEHSADAPFGRNEAGEPYVANGGTAQETVATGEGEAVQ